MHANKLPYIISEIFYHKSIFLITCAYKILYWKGNLDGMKYGSNDSIERAMKPSDTRLQHARVWSAAMLLQRVIAIVARFLAFLHPRGAAGRSVFVRFSPKIRVKTLNLHLRCEISRSFPSGGRWDQLQLKLCTYASSRIPARVDGHSTKPKTATAKQLEGWISYYYAVQHSPMHHQCLVQPSLGV